MPTTIVNTHDAKSRLSELIRLVQRGEEVLIARNGEVIAKLVPWPEQHRRRCSGAWAGRVTWTGDIVGSDPEVLEMFGEVTS